MVRHLAVSLALVAVLLVAPGAHASCSVAASPTTPCVSHNGSAYFIDTGNGFVGKPTLSAAANVPLRFEIDSNCSLCSGHPLYLSTSSAGAGAGFIAGGITTGSFTYTPSASDLSNGLYYQCEIHAFMGAQIVELQDGGASDAGDDAGDASDDASDDASSGDASSGDASAGDASAGDAGAGDAGAGDAGAGDAGADATVDAASDAEVADATIDAPADGPRDARADAIVPEPDGGTSPVSGGGCSGCAIDPVASPWGAAAAALGALALCGRRRRKRH